MEAQRAQVRLWSVKEVAAFLGVPVSWVYSHVADKSIPHLKIGHYVRFNAGEIAVWMRASHRG